jgi:hypothetical protein
MKHYASPQFWRCYDKLPIRIRKTADKCFTLLKENINHPSLHTKKIDKYWSVRIGSRYRALAIEQKEGLIWFWIGTHSEYDKLISS